MLLYFLGNVLICIKFYSDNICECWFKKISALNNTSVPCTAYAFHACFWKWYFAVDRIGLWRQTRISFTANRTVSSSMGKLKNPQLFSYLIQCNPCKIRSDWKGLVSRPVS